MSWLRDRARGTRGRSDQRSDAGHPIHSSPVASGFDDIFALYWEPLFRYCYVRLGSWEDAEDAAQNALFSVCKAHAGFSARTGDGSFQRWVFTVAYNETVDVYRKRGRRPEVAFPETFEIADLSPSPEDQAMASWQLTWLRDQLAHLSSDQRAVLELRLADLSGPAIAEVLGISHASVRQLQVRGEAKLRMLATPVTEESR